MAAKWSRKRAVLAARARRGGHGSAGLAPGYLGILAQWIKAKAGPPQFPAVLQ